MTTLDRDASQTPRVVLSRALLQILDDPLASRSRQANAAFVFQHFASRHTIGPLEAALLDPARDPWVRTYLLRAARRARVALSDAAVDRLCGELVRAIASDVWRPTWQFACADNVEVLLAIAASPVQVDRLVRFVRDLAPRTADEVLRAGLADTPRDVRVALSERCLAAGVLDAAATVEDAPPPAARPRPAPPSADREPLSREALIAAARYAPHVVLRAQALRSLRAVTPRPIKELQRALAGDRARYQQHYHPAVAEAALGLARCPEISELEALQHLVATALDLGTEDVHHAIDEAIASWLEGSDAEINPVWDALYAAEVGAPSR